MLPTEALSRRFRGLWDHLPEREERMSHVAPGRGACGPRAVWNKAQETDRKTDRGQNKVEGTIRYTCSPPTQYDYK